MTAGSARGMMAGSPLTNKVIFITGGARRIGRALALASAGAGADVIVHYHTSQVDAKATQAQLERMGRRAWILQADLADPRQSSSLLDRAFEIAPIYGLVNNASIFQGGPLRQTTLQEWDAHMSINLTSPFLLAQAFARLLGLDGTGRVVNLLDWRALRPGVDHFAYTISKAALASMTKSLALALAPRVSVNGLALGAILPPEGEVAGPDLTKRVPAGRWGKVEEVGQALMFLLTGPDYITGEVIHVDGGRHLV